MCSTADIKISSLLFFVFLLGKWFSWCDCSSKMVMEIRREIYFYFAFTYACNVQYAYMHNVLYVYKMWYILYIAYQHKTLWIPKIFHFNYGRDPNAYHMVLPAYFWSMDSGQKWYLSLSNLTLESQMWFFWASLFLCVGECGVFQIGVAT